MSFDLTRSASQGYGDGEYDGSAGYPREPEALIGDAESEIEYAEAYERGYRSGRAERQRRLGGNS